MDNRGASGDILDSIVKSGNRYLTGGKMNMSDDQRIREHGDGWEYVEDRMCCLKHTFDSSGRTTYLFFSLDSWYRSYHSASKSFDRMMKTVRTYRNGHFRRSDFVKQSISLILERDLVTSTKHFMGSPSLADKFMDIAETLNIDTDRPMG